MNSRTLRASFITSGPEEGEVIEETTRVTFEWDAKVSSETNGWLRFETKIEGFDDKWRTTYSKKRTATLPPGPQEYTFLVRAKIKDVTDLTPAKRTFRINTSPYLGKIKIYSVRVQSSSRLSLIRLSTRLKKEEEVNITGWQIRGKANSFIITSGIEKYYPGYNPVPGKSIFVKQGDKIYLSGGSNPLGRGRNYRPNKCLGYLTNNNNFLVSLPKKCPKPTIEDVYHLNPYCQEFVLKMKKCEIPDYSNNLRVSLDPECTSYLTDNFNYPSCF